MKFLMIKINFLFRKLSKQQTFEFGTSGLVKQTYRQDKKGRECGNRSEHFNDQQQTKLFFPFCSKI
jgi:hypothetical protein